MQPGHVRRVRIPYVNPRMHTSKNIFLIPDMYEINV